MLVPFIGEHAKKHLLVNILGAKRIHKNRSTALVSFYKRRALICFFQQLSCKHSPVNQIDPEVPVFKLTLAQFNIPWVSNRSCKAMAFKKFFEQLELTLSRKTFVINDANLRLRVAPSNVLIDVD